jgi:hypothetical protein
MTVAWHFSRQCRRYVRTFVLGIRAFREAARGIELTPVEGRRWSPTFRGARQLKV